MHAYIPLTTKLKVTAHLCSKRDVLHYFFDISCLSLVCCPPTMLCSLFYFKYPGTVPPQCFCTCCYLCSEYPGHNGTCYLFFFLGLIINVCECFACIYLYVLCTRLDVCWGRKRAFRSPGTALGVIVIYHVCAGNRPACAFTHWTILQPLFFIFLLFVSWESQCFRTFILSFTSVL